MAHGGDALRRELDRVFAWFAVHLMYCNFVKVPSKLRMSPAMAASVSHRLREIGDTVALVEAKTDRKRGLKERKTNRWRLVHSGHSGMG